MRSKDQSLKETAREFQKLHACLHGLPTHSVSHFREGLKSFANCANRLLSSVSTVSPRLYYTLKSRVQAVDLIYRFTGCDSSEWSEENLSDIKRKMLAYYHETMADPELQKGRNILSGEAESPANTIP